MTSSPKSATRQLRSSYPSRPYALYGKRNHDHDETDITLPGADELRDRVPAALRAVGAESTLGAPGEHGCRPAPRSPATCCSALPERSPRRRAAAIAEAARGIRDVAHHAGAGARRAGGAARRAARPSTRPTSAALVTIEAGKITSEALGEVQEMIDICEFAVGLSRQLYGRTIASERPGHRLMETWHPLGVVGVITAFNFPVAVWAWNAAVALVCGDTVVWKPSEKTPLTALACQALLERAAAESARRARSAGWSWAAARSASCWSTTRGSRWCQRDRLGADGPRGRTARSRSGSAGRCWNWAATTPPSSRRRPTSTSPCAASCSPRPAPPGSAARRCAG